MDLEKLFENQNFMDAFVQIIVDEVIKRIKNRPKTALVLFSGAAIGFKEAIDSLKKLKADGWCFKVFLSEEAKVVLNPGHIKKELGVDIIYDGSSDIPQKELYAEVDCMILASTSMNTAAKIACGICDSPMLTIINHGIMAGTPMALAVDGACPDNEIRAKLGMGKSPKGYRKMLRDNLDTIQSFGVKLSRASNLYKNSIDICSNAYRDDIIEEDKNQQNVTNEDYTPDSVRLNQAVSLEKRIISRGDIMVNRLNKKLLIPKSSIITEFAKEAIAEFGIEVDRI